MRTICFILLISIASCNGNTDKGPEISENINSVAPPPMLQYNVVKVYPHDTTSFTEGLLWFNNTLFEGTGNKGESKLMKLDINTGKASQEVKLDKQFFGEGISILNNKVYQLTWQEHKAFVYDLSTFKKIQEFEWPYEGWGMTHDGKNLIIGTGSNSLYYVDPNTFKILKTVGVSDNNGPVANINELEYVNGFIYANIYQTKYIIKINPETGTVVGKLDLDSVMEKNGVKYNANTVDVLNGIAYDSAKNSFYITGKNWPALFEVKIN